MLTILLRAGVMYLVITIAVRFMGKKQLGELEPSELVITILISNLASVSIESTDIPLLASIVPVFALACLEILVSAFSFRSPRTARILSGRPRIIIYNGTVDQTTLYELRLSMSELLAALRQQGFFELSEVSFAMIEINGAISVYKKQDNSTLPSLPLVSDGVCTEAYLRLLNVDYKWVQNICKQHHCTINQVLLLLCNERKETILIQKENIG